MLLALGLLFTAPSLARETSREYTVKAAYVYRVAQFVDWPDAAAASTPLVVCILGIDPFGAAIDYLEEKTSRGRRFSLHRLAESDSQDGCHILFISDSETDRLTAILDRLEGHRALTISDAEGFAHRGGMVGLVEVGDKIGLEINRDAAEAAGLRISAKLLELSRIVKHRKRGGER